MLPHSITVCLTLTLCLGRIAAEPVAKPAHPSNPMPAESAVLPVSDVIPEDGSGIAVFDEILVKFAQARKAAVQRFEKKSGEKYNDIYSDDLDPENEYRIALIDGFKKAKGTEAELLILLLISEMKVFSDEETYPAFLSAWKKHPKRWEGILIYSDGVVHDQFVRAVHVELPADKRAIYLWVLHQQKNIISHMEKMKPEDWLKSKTFARWFVYQNKNGLSGPKRAEDFLPSYASAVSDFMYEGLNFVKEKLCTTSEANDSHQNTRTYCESALKSDPFSDYAKGIRKKLNDTIPKLEKELAEHPELWPKKLPKWDGSPAWEITIKGE